GGRAAPLRRRGSARRPEGADRRASGGLAPGRRHHPPLLDAPGRGAARSRRDRPLSSFEARLSTRVGRESVPTDPRRSYCEKAWNSATWTVCAALAGPAVAQSVFARGSLSCSPAKSGPPVHWFVRTRKRTWVAFVFGTSNDRMISSGARGRGATDGKASGGLV